MKANNYIKQLKEIVNNNVLESIECVNYGVQAYGISANEYEVITKFAKINGRYYFIDRDGNRYLASRYDRAELVARDIIDNLRFAEETAYEYVCMLEEKKQVAVNSACLPVFFDFCDLFGFDVESVEMHFHNNGEVFTFYRLKSEQTAQDDAQSEETAADEQKGESNEQSNEGSENEENAAACEPSKFAGILAKAKDFAQEAAEKAGFVLSLVIIFAVGLLSVCVAVSSVASIVEALGLLGSIWGALLGSVLVLTVGLDFMAFVVINAMAILSRFFPSEFEKAQKPRFTKPFSFMYRLISESL